MATTSEALAIAIQHHQNGRLQAAEQIYRQILAVAPDHADAINLLGVVAAQTGRHAVAAEYIRRAIALNGNVAAFHNNLGNVLKDQGKLEEAVDAYRRAVQLQPDYAEAHDNLGNAMKDQRKLNEAIACYRRAMELKPDYAAAHNNLGTVFQELGKLDEAAACYRRAVELKPDFALAHNNLGSVFQEQRKLDEAIACCRRAVELKPDYAEAHNNLGIAWNDRGNLDEAVACWRRALEMKPNFAVAHSNLVFALQYSPDVTLASLAEAHAEFDRRHAVPLRAAVASFENRAGRHDRLRLGFVSPDLKRHPVGYFLIRALENLSREEYETVCYSDRVAKDDLTERFQAAASQWRDVFGVSDQRLAEQVRADGIDILFDLAGHTSHNRLLVFARKPAPVQITWIGYEGTTGLAAMDYLLADRYVIPGESERYYRERVLRMPDGYLCYDPPATAPPAGPLPALQSGYVTFGSFNNLVKITPQVVAVWAEILRRCPTARLALKYRGLDQPTVKQRFLDLFATRGVPPQRLGLLSSSAYAEYLAEYQKIDIVLDPFPFSGGTTTCEALWMGVPVVTCPGETFASRHSFSHLSNVGLTETIAGDLNDYVELAVSLANDLPRLAALRVGLRQRMAVSPLCDGKRFASNLAVLLRDVWQRHVENVCPLQ